MFAFLMTLEANVVVEHPVACGKELFGSFGCQPPLAPYYKVFGVQFWQQHQITRLDDVVGNLMSHLFFEVVYVFPNTLGLFFQDILCFACCLGSAATQIVDMKCHIGNLCSPTVTVKCNFGVAIHCCMLPYSRVDGLHLLDDVRLFLWRDLDRHNHVVVTILVFLDFAITCWSFAWDKL